MSYYTDLNLDFTIQNDGDLKLDTNEDAVVNSIKNIFRTFQGSRRMLPEFALGAYHMLFEPIDEITASSIGEIILSAIEYWDDRIIVENLNIYPNHDYEQYDITLTLRIQNIRETVKINEILKRQI